MKTMKEKMFFIQELDFRLNINNFFSVSSIEGIEYVSLLAWHTDTLEKHLYNCGYQVTYNEQENVYEYRDQYVEIQLHEKSL